MKRRISGGKLKGISGAFSLEISSNMLWRPSEILVGEIENRSNKIEKVSCSGFSIPNSVLIKLAACLLIVCNFSVMSFTWLSWQLSSCINVLFSMMIKRKGKKGSSPITMMKLPIVPLESGSNALGFIAKLIAAIRKGTHKHPINEPKICH